MSARHPFQQFILTIVSATFVAGILTLAGVTDQPEHETQPLLKTRQFVQASVLSHSQLQQEANADPSTTNSPLLSTRAQKIAFASGEMTEEVLEFLTENSPPEIPKVHSNLLLGVGPHRHRVILSELKNGIDQGELLFARLQVNRNGYRFDKLLARRNAIMALQYREQIPELLTFNALATKFLARRITSEISNALIARATARGEVESRRAIADAKPVSELVETR